MVNQSYFVMQTRSGKPLQIIIAGLSLSGKNQRRKRIQECFPILNSSLESGKILRDRSSAEDELGVILAGYLKRGEHIPDEILNQLFRDEYCPLRNKNLLLDGFFRNPSQVDHHLPIMKKCGAEVLTVVVDTPVEECRFRVKSSKKDPDRKGRSDQDSLLVKIDYDLKHWSKTKERLFFHMSEDSYLVVPGLDQSEDLKLIEPWVKSFLQIKASSTS